MDRSILRRIEELERQQPNSIVCLVRNMETGEEREMPMLELANRFGEWDLVKVVHGNDLTDFGKYLDAFWKYIKEDSENESIV